MSAIRVGFIRRDGRLHHLSAVAMALEGRLAIFLVQLELTHERGRHGRELDIKLLAVVFFGRPRELGGQNLGGEVDLSSRGFAWGDNLMR